MGKGFPNIVQQTMADASNHSQEGADPESFEAFNSN